MNLNFLDLIHCIRTCIIPFKFVMHHIDFNSIFFFGANLQSALGFVFCSFALCFGLYPSTIPRKTRAHRTPSPSTSSESPSRSEMFRNDRSREAFETLNSKRKIWAE